MSYGPCLIFDKSILQGLNPDEANWLDNFFPTNITPIFFIETLADLEKEVRAGRTAEEVVGSLAYKTPDMGSRPNVHHARIIEAELVGGVRIEMDGRPVVAGGTLQELDGKTGLVFRRAPEEEAFHRWQRREFLDLERTLAKRWRRALSKPQWPDWNFASGRPKSVTEVRSHVDQIIDQEDQEQSLRLGAALLNMPAIGQDMVLQRWRKAGRPAVRAFAPFFAHVYAVDLFFHLAVAAGLVSRDRPSHKIDMAYLYYLPFCNVFTSSDRLHALTAPLFLRSDQTFVPGMELKADLAMLDAYYSSLPEEIRRRGVFRFASNPPADTKYLTTRLWDKHRPLWREHSVEIEKALEAVQASGLGAEIIRFAEESVPVDRSSPNYSHVTPQTMTLTRMIYPRKGK
jgi:hypothetical protein